MTLRAHAGAGGPHMERPGVNVQRRAQLWGASEEDWAGGTVGGKRPVGMMRRRCLRG